MLLLTKRTTGSDVFKTVSVSCQKKFVGQFVSYVCGEGAAGHSL
jgi:hypothetical protein